MICLRIKPPAVLEGSPPLLLGDAAFFLSDASLLPGKIPLPAAESFGVFCVSAPMLVRAVHSRYPGETVHVLGMRSGWFYLENPRAPLRRLRRAAALLMLKYRQFTSRTGSDSGLFFFQTGGFPMMHFTKHLHPSFSLLRQPQPADRETRWPAACSPRLERHHFQEDKQ